MAATNKEPYQQAYYPPAPPASHAPCGRSCRGNCIRFVVINLKMIKLMANSHH